jgi:ATP-dependent DNA helicase RecG
MPESQNIEYKQNWSEDYLKWIAGFANAKGGRLYIGINDDGSVHGFAGYAKLMDELPNKVRDLMGIVIEVNLLQKQDLFYVEIIVQPYSVPISLRGRYYTRIGTTKQELTGTALTDFLLKKSGKTWDEIIEPDAALSDIDEPSVKTYIQAALNAGRIADVDGLSTAEILLKLRLTDPKGRLKRAAVVLFGKDPGIFINNCIVKIGRFGKDDTDLKFQEVVEGNLVYLLKQVPLVLNQKFLIKPVSFEGLQRIEKGEYPVAALREMLLNALVHRNYMGAMVQIKVYDNKFSIWNEGILPDGLTLAGLAMPHPSMPRNVLIAEVCFKGGYIDSWGRGIMKITNACKEAGLPKPEITELSGGILVTVENEKYTYEKLQQAGLSERMIKAVLFANEHGKITNADYQSLNTVSRFVATRELLQLVDTFKILKREGKSGRGTSYVFNDI